MQSNSRKKKQADSQAARIRKKLEEEIFLGIIQPGQRLDEQSEAKRFGVSRTPVREALSYLASSGLVRMESRRGATVTQITVPQIIEMIDVLAQLEDLCAALAAQNMSTEELNRFKDLHEKCTGLVRQGRIGDYYRVGKDFHELIYYASGNAFLAESCASLRNRIFPYLRYQLLHRPGRAEACLREQQLIVDAMIARDSATAARWCREHLRVQRRVFSEFIQALENAGMAADKFDLVPQSASPLLRAPTQPATSRDR